MAHKTITTMKYAPALARALGEPKHIAHVRILGNFASKKAFAEALDAAKLAFSIGVEIRDASVEGRQRPELLPDALYALRVDGYRDEPRPVADLIAGSLGKSSGSAASEQS